jgi:hypothetical protein
MLGSLVYGMYGLSVLMGLYLLVRGIYLSGEFLVEDIIPSIIAVLLILIPVFNLLVISIMIENNPSILNIPDNYFKFPLWKKRD